MVMTWTLYLLTQHPEIEQRLLREIQAHPNRPFEFADVPHLTYTQMVLKESMRFLPPAWTLFCRQVVEEVELSGYRLRPGSWVFVFPYLLHRNQRLFEDPMRFDPQRFAPENEKQIPQYGYIPFGAGPRVCIGNAFAMMQMPLILANLLRRRRLQLADSQHQVRIQASLSLRPRGGLPMRVESATVGKDRLTTSSLRDAVAT